MSKPLTVDDLRDKLKKIQSACEHEKFAARVSVANSRDGDEGFSATITIRCGLCGMSMELVGVSPSRARTGRWLRLVTPELQSRCGRRERSPRKTIQ